METRAGTRARARAGTGEERLFSRRYAAATLAFCAVNVLTALSALAVVPTLPVAVRSLHGLGLYPLVAGAFVAASLFGGVLGGAWADRAGARTPLAAGTALAVVTLLVSACSVSVWQLAAGRFLDGIAAGVVTVSVNAAIGQRLPTELQGRVLALMAAGWVGPSLVGPPLASVLVSWTSWRVVYFGLAAVTALPAVALVVVLRRTRPGAAVAADGPPAEPARQRPTLVAAALVSVGAALAQYAVSGWSALHLGCGIAALTLLGAFAHRLLPGGVWRAGAGLPATVLLNCFASGAFFTLEAYVPLLLDSARHTPAAVTGLAFTGAALAWAGSSWFQSRYLTHVPRPRLVAWGAVLVAAAVGVAGAATLPGLPAALAGASLTVAAVGMGLVAPTLTVLSLAHVPADRQGYASGAMQTARNLGQVGVMAFASALFGLADGAHRAASGHLGGFDAAFALLLGPALAIALLAHRTRALAETAC